MDIFSRIEYIAKRYFGGMSGLSRDLKISRNTIYQNKKSTLNDFSEKLLYQLTNAVFNYQGKNVKINPDFIKHGTEPEIIYLDEQSTITREPDSKYGGINVPKDFLDQLSMIKFYTFSAEALIGAESSIEDIKPSFVPLSIPIKLDPSRHEAISIIGHSMTDENGNGIEPGSIVIYDKTALPKDGDVVIVQKNGKILLKIYTVKDGKICFESYNPKNGDIQCTNADDVRIIGVVYYTMKSFK